MATIGPFKDRLMGALHSAVGYFNQDNDPNSAIVKAAKDNDFNADQTTRLVEMFNTARTLYHYKSAADRTAQFKLADADVVLPSLFTVAPAVETKTAADHDYSAYNQRETDYHADTRAAKEAAELPKLEEGALSMDAVASQAMRAVRTLRQTAKIAEDEARVAAHNAARTFAKLASLFSYGFDRDKLSDQYARLVVGHKDGEWAPVIAKLAEFVPARNQAPQAVMLKTANCAVIDDRDLTLHLDLMKEARDWMEAESELLAASGQFTKEADEFEREYVAEILPFFPQTAVENLASFIRPEVIKAAQTVTTSKYKSTNIFGEPVEVENKSDSSSGDTPGISDAVTSLVAEGAKKPVSSFMETGIERAFSEPMARDNKSMSERLKNVQRGIMLQDLLVNDPVLAEEAPETVAEAYNAILQLAPEVASNKEVVRAILRQTVHSVAVSPYDAEIWTKLEQNLRNIRGVGGAQPMHQGGGVKK